MSENKSPKTSEPTPLVRCNMKFVCPIYWTGMARSWICIFVLIFIIVFAYWFYSLCCSFYQRAYRLDGINRLKQAGLGFHNYHDIYSSLPKAYTTDEKGRYLHSWRLSLLPFIESNATYDSVRKEEPWNSEYNRQFHGRGIRCYFSLEDRQENPNTPFTRYQVIVGQDTPFDGTVQRSFSDFERGLTDTFLVVESGAAVHWMSPLDLPAEALKNGIVPIEKGAQAVGSRQGGAEVLMADGSVRMLSSNTATEILIEMSRLKKSSQP